MKAKNKLIRLVTMGCCLSLLFACESNYLDAPKNPDKQVLLDLVNDVRSAGCDCGNSFFPPVSALVWNDTMELAAQNHSDDMADHGDFSHTGSDGSSVGDRLSALGYPWVAVGENIAAGSPTEAEVMDGWLNSPAHCANIMDAGFSEMGIATSGPYWTQVLGRK